MWSRIVLAYWRDVPPYWRDVPPYWRGPKSQVPCLRRLRLRANNGYGNGVLVSRSASRPVAAPAGADRGDERKAGHRAELAPAERRGGRRPRWRGLLTHKRVRANHLTPPPPRAPGSGLGFWPLRPARPPLDTEGEAFRAAPRWTPRAKPCAGGDLEVCCSRRWLAARVWVCPLVHAVALRPAQGRWGR